MSSDSCFSEVSNKENRAPDTPQTLASTVFKSDRKRVLFSPLPASEVAKPESLSFPRKGVLKSFTSSPMSSPLHESDNPLEQQSKAQMISSLLKALAGQDQSSKLDAYNTLLTLFKAYEKFPAKRELLGKVNELFDLLLADIIISADPDLQLSGLNDKRHPICARALKLSGFMLFNQDICQAVSNKRIRALLDNTLARMETPSRTKATASGILWIWHTQRLPRQAIQPSMAERILKSTATCEFPSIAVQQERLAVFARLLEQAPETLSKHSADWIPATLNLMLDNAVVMRQSALKVLQAAGRLYLRDETVGRIVQAHIKATIDQDTFLNIAENRLKAFLQETQGERSDGNVDRCANERFVADAWACVCTLLASVNPERGPLMAGWLKILSLVFGRSGGLGKVFAQQSWIRLIHVFSLHAPKLYKEKNLLYLRKPMLSILQSNSWFRTHRKAHDAALNTAQAMLYGLMTADTAADRLLCWDMLVVPLFKALLHENKAEDSELHDRSCALLQALLSPGGPIEPRHVSRLLESTEFSADLLSGFFSPRWVRSNIDTVVTVAFPCMQSFATAQRKVSLYQTLATSLRDAAAKEVALNAETMPAVAKLYHLAECATPLDKHLESSLCESNGLFYLSLISIALDILGPRLFQEPCEFHDRETSAMRRDPGPGSNVLARVFDRWWWSIISREDRSVSPARGNLLILKILDSVVLSEKSFKRSLSALSDCTKFDIMAAPEPWSFIAQTLFKRLQIMAVSKSKVPSKNISPSQANFFSTDREVAACCFNILAPGQTFGVLDCGGISSEAIWTSTFATLREHDPDFAAVIHFLKPSLAWYTSKHLTANEKHVPTMLIDAVVSCSRDLAAHTNKRADMAACEVQSACYNMIYNMFRFNDAHRGFQSNGRVGDMRDEVHGLGVDLLRRFFESYDLADFVADLSFCMSETESWQAGTCESARCTAASFEALHKIMLICADSSARDRPSAIGRLVPIFSLYSRYPAQFAHLKQDAARKWRELCRFTSLVDFPDSLHDWLEYVERDAHGESDPLTGSREAEPSSSAMEIDADAAALDQGDQHHHVEHQAINDPSRNEDVANLKEPSEDFQTTEASLPEVAQSKPAPMLASLIVSPSRPRVMVIPNKVKRESLARTGLRRASQSSFSMSQESARSESSRTTTSIGVRTRTMRRASPPSVHEAQDAEMTEGLLPNDSQRSRKRPRSKSKTPKRKRTRLQSHASEVFDGLPDEASNRNDSSMSKLPVELSFAIHQRPASGLEERLDSDPVSESSPSVYSRLRRSSMDTGLTDKPGISPAAVRLAKLKAEAKSLSPEPADDLDMLSDIGSPGRTAAARTGSDVACESPPKQATPSRHQVTAIALTSTHQAPEGATAAEEQEEMDDEDLFVLQLQQYRTSLETLDVQSSTDAVRRAKLGRLMQEINRLQTAVTTAFFA